MVVVTGWWMTTGPTLSLDVKRDPLIQTVTQQTQALKKTAETRALEEERVNDQIKRIQDELEQAKKDAEQK
jgi:ABC-type enterochelin transport system substrate-binding protein